MAGLLDSSVAFEQKVASVGLADKWDIFKAKGWVTYATFAFSASYVPGSPDDSAFVAGVIKVVLDDTDNRGPALRRLFFEAYTLFVGDLKSRMDRTDADPPRRLVVPEREARRQRLKLRLPGLDMEGELDVSYSLVDRCVQLWEDDVLSYIPWEACAHRGAETKNKRAPSGRELKADANGFIREREVPPHYIAELNSDLRVKNCLQRRGIALDMSNRMTFETHELLVRQLMESLQEDPPFGYKRIDIFQLQRTDEILFDRMIDLTRTGIRARPDGSLPLDKAVLEAVLHRKFAYAMAPRQSSGGKGKGKGPGGSEDKRALEDADLTGNQRKRQKAAEKKKAKAQEAAERDAAKAARPKKGAKGANGPKGAGKNMRVPNGLVGMDMMFQG
jgi:hypothetical protein